MGQEELAGITESVRTLALKVIQGEISRDTAMASAKNLVHAEAHVSAIVEEARSVTYAQPELALTLVRIGYEAARFRDSVLGTALCAFEMGTIHKARGQYQEALDRYTESLTTFQVLEHHENVCAALTQIGALYIHLGQYPRARDYLEHGLEISRQRGYRKQEGVQLGNLGIAFLLERFPI